MSLSYDAEGKVVRPVFTSDFEYCSGCTRRLDKRLFDNHTTCRYCRGVYDVAGSTKDKGI
jgi:hypothetical protein